MRLDEIIVIKNKKNIIICFNGCKFTRPIKGFENLSKEEIRNQFYNEYFNEEGGDTS